MIETKEQYKKLLSQIHVLWLIDEDGNVQQPKVTSSDVIEFIEALREVVKVAQFAKYMAASSLDRPLNKQLDKLRVALGEVPDWISEDN